MPAPAELVKVEFVPVVVDGALPAAAADPERVPMRCGYKLGLIPAPGLDISDLVWWVQTKRCNKQEIVWPGEFEEGVAAKHVIYSRRSHYA